MGKAEGVSFGELILDETCLFARRGSTTIQFTRNERALLLALSRNPQRLMSRSGLIEEIASLDSGASDRNIDFLVNRLRAKLGDSAKSPRYIATQYGEGYVWIAEPSAVPIVASPQSGPIDAYLAVVPASAVQRDRIDTRALSLLAHLRDGIAADLSPAQKVVIVDDWRAVVSNGLRYVLQVSFQTVNERPDCTATLREMPSRRIVRAFRLELADNASLASEATRVSRGTIKELRNALTHASAGLGTPSDQPLDIRLRKASTLLSSSNPAWLKKGQELSAARADHPADPDIALQWCLHLFARLVLANPFTGLSSEEREEIESEIEATALDCLPAVQSNPLLMLAAAKLLYFVDRGHQDLAEDLAERAFARTADFAAALPVMGQLRQARGNFDEAVILFDRGIEMADPESDFLLHMRVLKCIALLASGNRNALDAANTFAYDIPYSPPELVVLIGMTMTAPDQPLSEHVEKTLTSVGAGGVRNALEYVYFTSARHLIARTARANVMRGLVAHALRLHGAAAIPPIVLAGTGLIADA
ncbi:MULTISPECIES: helix-turn-helix domain-containing protein [Rhodopseudomonas]|uniref:winged helix-turn-helix domain-containing protein n=1 Tax=Rhodopseudomonas TaxID=1073 RepID=UPI0006988E37|nr:MULTISPECIES: helix-turn-helix domain-containing protein [Rhodopseudomonas]MDF3813525.1 helix-turn-helix domain-containing protein [Rhodopseudomonas sp. BAL398]WOK15375.1 helix-turn-helix domain-containing protein [Rhodopseudomonas sp. BAL398]